MTPLRQVSRAAWWPWPFTFWPWNSLRNVSRGTDNLSANCGVSAIFRCRVMGKRASDWRLDLITLTFDVTAHVGDAGHCTISVYLVSTSSAFVSLPVPKIWLTFSQGVKRPVDLDLDLSASKSGHGSPLSCASFLSIFSLLRPSVLDLGSGQTDRQTDRWRPSTLNVPSYVAGHFVVLLSLFRI